MARRVSVGFLQAIKGLPDRVRLGPVSYFDSVAMDANVPGESWIGKSGEGGRILPQTHCEIISNSSLTGRKRGSLPIIERSEASEE